MAGALQLRVRLLRSYTNSEHLKIHVFFVFVLFIFISLFVCVCVCVLIYLFVCMFLISWKYDQNRPKHFLFLDSELLSMIVWLQSITIVTLLSQCYTNHNLCLVCHHTKICDIKQ